MKNNIFLSLSLASLSLAIILTALCFAGGHITSNTGEIPITLTPNSSITETFNFSISETENVSLIIDNFYLTYSWTNQSISNQTAKNFTFIIPFSSNLTANLTWANSANLTLNLTNLRTGNHSENISGSGNISIINLNISQVEYGVWQAIIFGENVSAANETFNLTIKFLDNNFKINFTDIRHIFKNKTIENTTNWTFYVDNSVSSINVSLISNATNEINLSLYNSTDLSANNLINLTIGGNNWTFTTNITNGYWTVLLNNTNTSANFTYNFTIHLNGNNITKLGNLTNESHSIVNFNLTSPATKIVDGNYNNIITINATNSSQIILNISLSVQTLKFRAEWTENYYIGNQTLSVGETETYNTTRNLFINLNQTKSLIFVINNSGRMNLTNLSITNSTYNHSILNLTRINYSNTIIPAGETGYLNLTILGKTVGTSLGWIYLNSSNGQPFSYLNLTLNITITNQTLPRLNKTNSVYYFDSDNLTEINFSVYFFDNQTVDSFWNSSNYPLNITNSTDNVIQTLNFTFNSSTKLFSADLNTTNTSIFKEGYNYTILGNLNDAANNSADINLTFELLYNLDLNITNDLDSVVQGYPFNFTINISKLGNLTAENVSVCLGLPTGIENLDSNNCTLIGNINNIISNSTTWQLNGTTKGTHTINITISSEDGIFNKTEPQNIIVKYGVLNLTWETAPPSSKANNTAFTIKVKINNTGNWNATNVSVTIITDLSLVSGENPWVVGNLSIGNNTTYEWSLKGISVENNEDIIITASGDNTTSYTLSDEVDITTPSSTSDDSTSSGDTTTTSSYTLSISPALTSFEIRQGGTYSLEVDVKNTGNSELNDLSLTLTGISSDCYSITPSGETDLSSGITREYTIKFSIPEDLEAKDYELTLKAISDEKTETKSVNITVLELSIDFINLTNINITQGEHLSKKFKIKNTGEVTFHNLFINLSEFNITPTTKVTIGIGAEKEYEINFSVSKDEKIRVRELLLNITSDEKNFTKKFNLTILPCEEEKTRIKQDYENITAVFEDLMRLFEKTKKSIKNMSAVESKITDINQTLSQMKSYLEKGEYLEANKLIGKLKTDLNELSNILVSKTKSNSVYLIVFSVLVVSFIGFIIFYLYIPKKGYIPGKGYISESAKSDIENKMKNFFRRFSRVNSEEDMARSKKLEEWEKFYKEKKKNSYF